MPTISAIKQQLKRPDRYSIYLDGKYCFSLSESQLSESKLTSGQTLGYDEVEEYKDLSEVGKALQAAFGLLSYRGRSQQELTERLVRKGYDSSIIEVVLERLRQLKLLDDEDFARSWLGQTKSTTRSRHRLQQELRQKGIASELIKAQVEAVGEDHDKAAIKLLTQRRLNKNTAPDRRKLIAYLVRQGFSYGLVLTVLKTEFSEVDLQ